MENLESLRQPVAVLVQEPEPHVALGQERGRAVQGQREERVEDFGRMVGAERLELGVPAVRGVGSLRIEDDRPEPGVMSAADDGERWPRPPGSRASSTHVAPGVKGRRQGSGRPSSRTTSSNCSRAGGDNGHGGPRAGRWQRRGCEKSSWFGTK